jgi:hypothetical protein
MDIEKALNTLIAYPDPGVAEAAQGIKEHLHRRSLVMRSITEALGELRLDFKYMLFDLEATRRERDALMVNTRNEDENES